MQVSRRPGEQVNPNISAFIRDLPLGGFSDLEGFLEMQPGIRHWNENMGFSSDKLSMSHAMAVTARLVATLTLGRAFCFFGACYHATAGITKLVVVGFEYNNETKEKVSIAFKGAMNHLMLAVYNGVAAVPLVNCIFAGTYALFPQWVEEQHMFFAGTQMPIDLEKRQVVDAKRKELEALGCPQLLKVTGACIDAAGPYDDNGAPIGIPSDKRQESIIAGKAQEITSQVFERLGVVDNMSA
ncbi:MAG: hypothetical protein V4489_04950 [Chlamydiota bacterium]